MLSFGCSLRVNSKKTPRLSQMYQDNRLASRPTFPRWIVLSTASKDGRLRHYIRQLRLTQGGNVGHAPDVFQFRAMFSSTCKDLQGPARTCKDLQAPVRSVRR